MTTSPRVGLFGLIGWGNVGNDGSFEAVLAYLKSEYPAAVLEIMCPAPAVIRSRYGLSASHMHWNRAEYRTASGPRAIAKKALGKLIDPLITARWVWKQDAVIVPGMGVLEDTLPVRPWGFPYSLFMVCLAGRLLRRKVALVSIGAAVVPRPALRRLFASSARLAYYRSFRDEWSKESVRRMGVDTADDSVLPDLVFGLSAPPADRARRNAVGVGVMDYHGSNNDRRHGRAIHEAYLAGVIEFVSWLVEQDRAVRLFIGDQVDSVVARQVVDAVGSDLVTVDPIASMDDLMRQMMSVETVVATRYHNILCALKLGLPTLAVSYSEKSALLMRDFGLTEFCHDARAVDVPRLTGQFTELESRTEEVGRRLTGQSGRTAERVRRQFDELSSALFDEISRGGR